MIQRIKIKDYKSLRNVDIKLKPLSVLFGPNAAGKSNFFDALQLLSRIAGSRSLKEAFEPPYRGKPLESFSFAGNGIEDLLLRDSITFSIEVDVELSPTVIAAVDKEILETKRGQAIDAGTGEGRRSPSFIHHRRYDTGLRLRSSPGPGCSRLRMNT